MRRRETRGDQCTKLSAIAGLAVKEVADGTKGVQPLNLYIPHPQAAISDEIRKTDH